MMLPVYHFVYLGSAVRGAEPMLQPSSLRHSRAKFNPCHSSENIFYLIGQIGSHRDRAHHAAERNKACKDSGALHGAYSVYVLHHSLFEKLHLFFFVFMLLLLFSNGDFKYYL